MAARTKKRRKDATVTVIMLLGIILLAAFLRLYDLNATPGLDYDSAAYAQRVNGILEGKEVPEVGFQIYFGPIFFYWLAALSSIFGLSIIVMRAFLAIVGVLTVVMVYLLGKEYFNRTVGLVAALLVAISVWNIAQSRLIWEINVLPLYVTIILYLLPKSLKKKELVVFIGLLLGIAFQIHNTGILLVPIVIFFYLLHDRRIFATKFALLAIVAFLLAYSPVIQFNITHQFTTLDYYKRLISGNTENKSIESFLQGRTIAAFDIMKENFSGPWRFTNPVNDDLFLNFLLKTPVIFAMWIFSFLILLDKTLHKKKKAGIFLAVSNLFLFIAIAALGNGVVTHYFTLVLPFAFVAVAVLIDFLIKNKTAKSFVILFIMLLVVQNLNYLYKDYFQYYYSVGGTGFFETSRCCKEKVASFIRKNVDNSTKLYFEDDLNLYNPVAFYSGDYSYFILKNCNPDDFAQNSTKQVFVFNFNSTCDQSFRMFSTNLARQSRVELITSPSGETNVYSIYIV